MIEETMNRSPSVAIELRYDRESFWYAVRPRQSDHHTARRVITMHHPGANRGANGQ